MQLLHDARGEARVLLRAEEGARVGRILILEVEQRLVRLALVRHYAHAELEAELPLRVRLM